jgi:hypothetical protein
MKMSEPIDAEFHETTSLAARQLPAVQLSPEIQAGIVIAQSYPRDVAVFSRSLCEAATADRETAAMCFYSKPQGNGTVQGPSVRLAELAAAAYHHLANGSRPGSIDRENMTVTGIGFAHDLQSNSMTQAEVVRPIRDKYGRIYSEPMINVTRMAAAAIARRNAILQVIPRVYVDRACNAAMRLVSGGGRGAKSGKAVAESAQNALAALANLGADADRVLASIGKASVDMMTPEDIVHLRGCYAGLRDGTTMLDDVFPPPVVPTSGDVDELPD